MLIAVDFDGTLVTHEYPRIGKEIPFAFTALKQLQDLEHQLILWTVREGEELKEAVEYCKSRGIEFYAINSNYPDIIENDIQPRKLKVDLFIDDRNLGGLPDWGIIYKMIAANKALEPFTDEILSEYEVPKKKGIFSFLFE